MQDFRDVSFGDVLRKVVRPAREARRAYELATENDVGGELESEDEQFFLGFALGLALAAGSDHLRDQAHLDCARRLIAHPTLQNAFLFFSTGSMPTLK